MTKISRLLGNTVLLKPLPFKTTSLGGLALPPNAKYQPDQLQFTVLAVGPGRVVRKKGKVPVTIPIEVDPGDRVLLSQYHGNRFAFDDGSGCIIVDASEIIAKY